MDVLISVEESSWNQNKSSTWYEQRIERITVSIAHQASKCICQTQCHPINSAILKW